MTHIMVPDGVLPWWLPATGWLLAAALLSIAAWRVREAPAARMVPLAAVMTAVMVVVMSLEVVPIGYEPHLTVLTGILIGPWYGAMAAFLFNLLRALLGDGAFTNIGLNTMVTWIEIATGAAAYWALRPLLRRRRPALAAGIATVAGLFIATLVFIGVIGASRIDPAAAIHAGAFSVEAGGFQEGALSEGLLGVRLKEQRPAPEAPGRGVGWIDWSGFARFAAALLLLGAIGWSLEALLTGAIVAFIARVRPELLRLPARQATG
jgi:ABC-type Co2+ transport system permease subunit